MIGGLKLLVPTRLTSREGRKAEDGVQSPMANDLINDAYVMKPP